MNANYDGQGKSYEEEAHGSMVVVLLALLGAAGVALFLIAWAILAVVN